MFWLSSLRFERAFFTTRKWLVAAVLFMGGTPASAANSSYLEVNEDGGVYSIKASVMMAAPAQYVRNVLTDFVHIYRLNPSIVESEVLATMNDGAMRVRTIVSGCVAIFCREIERVEKVRILKSGNIQAEVIPEASAFESGVTLWKIEPAGERSRVVYEAVIEPGFFIPPLIGSAILRARLQKEITTSFRRLENIASVQLQRDLDNGGTFSDRVLAENSIPCNAAELIRQ